MFKTRKKPFNHKAILKFCIADEKNFPSPNLDSKFALLNSLFGAVKLSKNSDSDKYSYSAYCIGLIHVELFIVKW